MTKTLAVVGIDGSGKSAFVRNLEGEARTTVLHCPLYHADPDVPLGATSRALAALSTAADAIGSFELKGLALYLQMTIGGPVLAFVRETFAPARIVFERHPIVDAMAYGRLYVQAPLGGLTAELKARAREALRAAGHDDALDRAERWYAFEKARLGLPGTFADLPPSLRELFGRPVAELLPELARRFRCALPDTLLLVEVDPEEAFARLRGRDGDRRELHESAAGLAELRRCYDATLEALAAASPAMAVRRITLGPDAAADVRALEAWLSELW